MNRQKLVAIFYEKELQLVLELNGFIVLYFPDISGIEEGEGANEGNVRIFQGGKQIGNLWDVKEIYRR